MVVPGAFHVRKCSRFLPYTQMVNSMQKVYKWPGNFRWLSKILSDGADYWRFYPPFLLPPALAENDEREIRYRNEQQAMERVSRKPHAPRGASGLESAPQAPVRATGRHSPSR